MSISGQKGTKSKKTQSLWGKSGHGLLRANGGLETVMVVLEELDLPQFASFSLLAGDAGQPAL